jgi:hypothetical protein
MILVLAFGRSWLCRREDDTEIGRCPTGRFDYVKMI